MAVKQTKDQKAFVEQLAGYVQTYAPQYGISVCSPIIAQGILESAWGRSKLSEEYHNYFGLKCGSRWTGKSVNMTTQEEYQPGTKTTIKDNFRVYDSMEEGVKGYFEFIQLVRYQNLKGITDPLKYLQTIRDDGYATASDYAADCYKVVEAYDLTAYDPKVAPAQPAVKVQEKDIILYGHGSGTPSRHNLLTYTTQRYKQTAPNGKHKGVAAVRRFKALTDEGRVKFEAKFRTTLGRNKYSQDLRGYVYKKYKDGNYYSDCSAIGMDTLRAIGYKVGSYLLNTAGIYYSDLFEDIPVIIKDGHITNPEILKVGDPILYIGNDPSRPKQIGHVEWVAEVPAVAASGGQGGTNTGKTDKNTADAKKGYTGTFPVFSNLRNDYRYGDGIRTLKNYPTQIRRVQELLNWITGESIAVDGQFGAKTQAACRRAQGILGVPVTGRFDKGTLAASKAYKR